MDEATAKAIRQEQSDDFRVRRLARVRPSGLETDLEIYELLDAPRDGHPALTDQQIRQYEESLDALIRGDWEAAYQHLHALPAWDRPKDVLLSTILRYNRVPPENWSGVIDLPKY